MSLYYTQKFLYELNRNEQAQAAYAADRQKAIAEFVSQGAELSAQEAGALSEPNIGLLFHLGVNGQILMHFAALHQIDWQDYLERMRLGIEAHGPVREGVYAVTGYEGTAAHSERLGQAASPAAATTRKGAG